MLRRINKKKYHLDCFCVNVKIGKKIVTRVVCKIDLLNFLKLMCLYYFLFVRNHKIYYKIYNSSFFREGRKVHYYSSRKKLPASNETRTWISRENNAFCSRVTYRTAVPIFTFYCPETILCITTPVQKKKKKKINSGIRNITLRGIMKSLISSKHKDFSFRWKEKFSLRGTKISLFLLEITHFIPCFKGKKVTFTGRPNWNL